MAKDERRIRLEDLERELAEELPDREALSLLDTGGGLIGGNIVDPLGAGGVLADPGTGGDQTQILPIDDGQTSTPAPAGQALPAAPLADIATDLAGTAADAAATDADGDTTIGDGGGEYNNSDSASSET